eukprot:111831-Chlamydomonas_euryale.AAC.6
MSYNILADEYHADGKVPGEGLRGAAGWNLMRESMQSARALRPHMTGVRAGRSRSELHAVCYAFEFRAKLSQLRP